MVMDRGYIDYKLFSRWTKAGIHFVTRLKENADYAAWEDRPIPKGSNVTKDRLIRTQPFHGRCTLPRGSALGKRMG